MSGQGKQLGTGTVRRQRQGKLYLSEIMTIVIQYQISGYRTFKWFYLKHVKVFWQDAFPNLPSYNRFVELMSEILEPLAAFMQSRCGKSEGIAFVDSTPLCVCDNLRIPRHKTFAGVAGPRICEARQAALHAGRPWPPASRRNWSDADCRCI